MNSSAPDLRHSSLPPPDSALSTQHSALKLGLLGGSFNPIHNGHLALAGHVLDKLQLDHILFIPTGDPPHKQDGSLAPAAHRYEMVRLAIADKPAFGLSDMEIRRTGKSYTIDTVQTLQHQFGPSTDLHLLIGLDAFLDLPNWKDPRELLRRCRFVVVPRPGQSFQSLATMPLLPVLPPQALMQLDTGESLRLDIAIPSCRGIVCLSIPPCSTSASDIRERIRHGMTLANLLPPLVGSYILQHHVYQEE
ncbi:MAG: nicotinate (nicotinamide) nucleotide adenylyltransferase [Nitrospira sp.]|nr:nicotinate (nicotinamide) nucleotide adenylyltransferase [Nitrospira sp.]